MKVPHVDDPLSIGNQPRVPIPAPKAHLTSTTSTDPRMSCIPVPMLIPQRTYADAVLVEDINEVKEAGKEEIVTPVTPLLENPRSEPASTLGPRQNCGTWSMQMSLSISMVTLTSKLTQK